MIRASRESLKFKFDRKHGPNVTLNILRGGLLTNCSSRFAGNFNFKFDRKHFLNVALRWLVDQGQQGVKVDVELATNKLGALVRVLEAEKVALDDSLYTVQQHDLVGVVQVKVAQCHFALSRLPLRELPERRNSRGPSSHDLIVSIGPPIEMYVDPAIPNVVVEDLGHAPIVDGVLRVDVYVQQVKRLGREECAAGGLLLTAGSGIQNLSTVRFGLLGGFGGGLLGSLLGCLMDLE